MPQITQPLHLGTSNDRQTQIRFDADHTTSDAGLVLLSRLDARVDVCGRMARAIHDRRNLLYVTHPLSSLLRQRVFALALGWTDCNDAGPLRVDPALKMACGRAPVSGISLASQPTLSRLENMVDESDNARMSDALLDTYFARQGPRRKRRLIVIDADATDDQTHGHQEWSHYNKYYGHTCFTPLLVFDGGTDDLLSARLRPGNAGTGDGLLDELERIVPRLKACWPKARLRLRVDGGFAWPGIFAFCEREGLEYLIAMQASPVLTALAAQDLAEVTRRGHVPGGGVNPWILPGISITGIIPDAIAVGLGHGGASLHRQAPCRPGTPLTRRGTRLAGEGAARSSAGRHPPSPGPACHTGQGSRRCALCRDDPAQAWLKAARRHDQAACARANSCMVGRVSRGTFSSARLSRLI